MNTTNNSRIDYSMFSLEDFCIFLKCGDDYSLNRYLSRNFTPFDISKVEMYEYLKFKTDNFDKLKFQLVFDEICQFSFEMDFYRLVKTDGKFISKYETEYKEIDYIIPFHKPTEFIRKTLELNKGLTVNCQQVVVFIELAENLYQTICEQAPGNTTEGTPEQKPFAGLLMELNDEQLEQLFKFFNEKTTDRKSFDYIFGKDKEKPENLIPIEWTGTKQLLRELLTGLQKEIKYNRQNPETRELSNEIERQTPIYFTKDEKPLKLAKNKPIPSYGSDAIIKFLATI